MLDRFLSVVVFVFIIAYIAPIIWISEKVSGSDESDEMLIRSLTIAIAVVGFFYAMLFSCAVLALYYFLR